MTYRKFKQAIKVFGLGERATLAQIKDRHRQLVKTHHPDHGKDTDPEAIRRVNCAYEALTAYCETTGILLLRKNFLSRFPRSDYAASLVGIRYGAVREKPKKTDSRGHPPARKFRSGH